MSKFAVPRQYQQTALMIGIVLALIMRAIFIVVGAAAINQFSWVFYIFGLFLIYTAWKLAKEGNDDEDEYEENRLVKFAEKRLPATSEWHGTKIIAKENGKRLITPMFFVMLTLGTTDLLFALDSIPAIYGLTQDPYLVFTANVFALMGLRQLYFLIGGLLQRLVYLSYGLAFLLGFIGVKLMLHALHTNELPFINDGEHVEWAPEIPIWLSLVVIIGTLAVTADREPGQGPLTTGAGPRPADRRNSRRGRGVRARVSPRRTSLSVLDLVPVRTDQTTGDALAATVALARVADELGYRRYWLAEHHNMPAVAATNPPVLIAMVAGATERIRVGSGGVMLPNHAPLVVAEQFALLEAAHPGRIDLGIGRAPGTDPVTSFALRHGAGGVSDEAVTRFPEYVDNVLAMMDTGGVGLNVAGPAARAAGHPAAPPACRRSGCSGPRTTPRGWPRRRGCPTCSRTTSPARAPPRRWSCTARSSGPRRSSPSRGPS